MFGILTIILVYLTAKKIFGKNAALIAAVLAAVNPFLISYSIEAKSYSCYGLVLLLTVYFLVSKKISLFALSYLVALNLHYMSLLFAPPIFIFYTYLLITKKIRLKTTLPQTAMLLVGTLLTYYIVLQKGPTTWIRGANFWNIPRSLIAYSYGVQAKLASSNALNELSFPLINSYILGGVIVTLWIVSLAIAWHKSKEHEREGLAFMVMLIVIPQPTVTFFLISVGYVLTKLLSFEVMALILIAYTFTLTKIKPPDYNVGMKTLAKTFSTSPQEIVFTSPSDFTVGEYYLGADVKLYDPKNPEEPHSALYISSDSDKMTADFQEVDYPTDFGSYKVYTKIH